MNQPGQLSDQQVDLIAARLAERLGRTTTPQAAHGAAPASPTPATEAPANNPVVKRSTTLGEGVFAELDDAVEAARTAFFELDGMSLEGRLKIIACIRESMTVKLPADSSALTDSDLISTGPSVSVSFASA